MSTPEHEPGRIPQWTLGDRLRKAREDAGLQQQELAEAMGISRRSVSAYESDASHPRRPVRLSWALATGVKLNWLEDEAPRSEAQPGGEEITPGISDGGNTAHNSDHVTTDSEEFYPPDLPIAV